MRHTVAVILAIILAISSLVGFINDPQRAIAKESKELLKQAEQMIDNGEYDSALGFLDQISTEWEDYSKTDAVRQSAERGILMDEINAYQSSDNYEGLIAFIDGNVQNVDSDAEIRAIYESAAQKCKENILEKITVYMESDDYLGAIQYIDLLGSSMKEDDDIEAAYDNAVASYETAVISEAESFAQAGDYTSARSTLSVAENYIGRTTALADKIAEVNERELTAEVLALIEAENYGDAIVLLNKNATIVAGSSDLQTKLNTYTEKYRANIIEEAANTYKLNGYEASVILLNSALKVLPNDAAIISEKAKYERAVPVSLIELDVTKQGDFLRVGNYYGCPNKDVSGKTYSSSGTHWLYELDNGKPNMDGENSITYYLNQEYDILTGIMFRPYITLSCWFDWDSDGRVKIYGDGTLLYEGAISQDSFDAVRFTVDIKGVRELTIELGGFWREENRSDVGYEWLPKLCVTELQVAKEP